MNGVTTRGDTHADGRLRVHVVSTSLQVWGAERSVLGLEPLLEVRGVALTLASPPGRLSNAWSAWDAPHAEFAVPGRTGLRPTGGGRPCVRALARDVARTGRRTRCPAQLAQDVDAVYSNSLWGHLDSARQNRVLGAPGLRHDLVAAARRVVVVARHTLAAQAEAAACMDRGLARAGAER